MTTYIWVPLKVPHQGASKEYPQCMVSWRNKKNISLIPLLPEAIVIAILHVQNILKGWSFMLKCCEPSLKHFDTLHEIFDLVLSISY